MMERLPVRTSHPEPLYPTQAHALWASLLGHGIVAVRRQFLCSDYEELAPAVRDQESDGPTELHFEGGIRLHLHAATEQMSLQVAQGVMQLHGEHFTPPIRIEGNEFWKPRVGQPVTAVDVLISPHATPDSRSEFAVELVLANQLRAVFEYVSDAEHTDQLRIDGTSPLGNYQRMNVARLP
jgi:hypothetical protein